LEITLTEDRAYYNLRKRYGAAEARKVIDFWNHFNVDPPEDQDEAIEFYVFRGRA